MLAKNTIFLSYRRTDLSQDEVNVIHEGLENKFGNESVFLDTSDIDAGAKWKKVLNDTGENAKILLLLIGKNWLEKDKNGIPRINNPEDWVRKEIEYAIQKNLTVIPTLINGVEMPLREEMPESILPIYDSQSIKVDLNNWSIYKEKLFKDIQKILGYGKDSFWLKKIIILGLVIILIGFLGFLGFLDFLLPNDTNNLNRNVEIPNDTITTDTISPNQNDTKKIDTIAIPFKFRNIRFHIDRIEQGDKYFQATIPPTFPFLGGRIRFYIKDNQLLVYFYVYLEEFENDKSRKSGTLTKVLYSAPDSFKIQIYRPDKKGEINYEISKRPIVNSKSKETIYINHSHLTPIPNLSKFGNFYIDYDGGTSETYFDGTFSDNEKEKFLFLIRTRPY